MGPIPPKGGRIYPPPSPPSALALFGRNLGDISDFDVWGAKFGRPPGFEELRGTSVGAQISPKQR